MTTQRYQELAQSALRQYPISAYTLQFLRHHENLTYRVQDTTGGSSYVLRIHLPRHEGFQGLQQHTLALQSELSWLHALKQETDIPVQRPLLNLRQEFVTMLESPFETTTIPCTLLTWVRGHPFSQEAPSGERLVSTLGELMAKLHAHAQTWCHPEPFLRFSYDAQLLQGALAKLRIGVQQGIVNGDDASNALEAGEYIVALLKAMRTTPDIWGMIHADFPNGNVLVQGKALIPIDFSLSGFGPYLLDIGICLSNLQPSLRAAYLQGYGGPLSETQRHQIEAFIIMMILISSTRHLTNTEWHAWFQRRFPVIAQTYCPKLLRKETFLFDI
ncbi:MAG: phosphotransferase [Candidatus Electrothrix scaldis]|nr:MAG: phosphotransferase [Candidatus Electrothrix sp. GW3-3]